MGLGIAQFLGGLGRLFDKLPIQGRRERWRNEIENLTKEKNRLLLGACDEKKAKRVEWIDSRIAYLQQLCKNSEKD